MRALVRGIGPGWLVEGQAVPPRAGPGVELSPQLTAFFTSAPILASSAAVNFVSAKAVGHMAPSSRFAWSLKPSVAYLVLNFCALWKKQRTLPSLAYAGIPYQSLGERAGALALMTSWSRPPMARSGFGISAIFASRALSPSAFSACGPRRAETFISWTRSFMAARSSSVNPANLFSIAVVLLAAFCLAFIGGFSPARIDGNDPMLGCPPDGGFSKAAQLGFVLAAASACTLRAGQVAPSSAQPSPPDGARA